MIALALNRESYQPLCKAVAFCLLGEQQIFLSRREKKAIMGPLLKDWIVLQLQARIKPNQRDVTGSESWPPSQGSKKGLFQPCCLHWSLVPGSYHRIFQNKQHTRIPPHFVIEYVINPESRQRCCLTISPRSERETLFKHISIPPFVGPSVPPQGGLQFCKIYLLSR